MRRIVSRAISWMSTYVVVEISPDTTTRPVFTSVSQATRPVGSSRSTASRTPSEIWSAILSGWPSVEVDDHRYALQSIALAQPILYEVCVVARDALARVHLDREARRARADL